ncbi:MAG: cell surface protein, partial [Algoriphagus sp. 32-45-6]
GTYQLSVKSKAFTCFSDPIPLEVIIKEEELEVDFDFVVEGTDIRDDQSGGIFPDDPIVFTPLADLKAVSWSWDFGNGSISNTQNATHVFGKKGEFPVTLTITDELGCEASLTKTVSITRSYRVMVPTGFTPTEPENKTFLPKWKGIAEMELLIYNLWGELIFKTSDLETSGWDGTLSGKLLEPGLFVYQFRGKATDGEKVEESGKFRLIR